MTARLVRTLTTERTDETMSEAIGQLIPGSVRGPFAGEDGWGRENWRNPVYEAKYTCGHVLSLGSAAFPQGCLICTGQWPKNAASNFMNVKGKTYPIHLTRGQLHWMASRNTGDATINAQIQKQLERAEAEQAVWGDE